MYFVETYKELTYGNIDYQKYGCKDLPEFFNKFMNDQVMISRLFIFPMERLSNFSILLEMIPLLTGKQDLFCIAWKVTDKLNI